MFGSVALLNRDAPLQQGWAGRSLCEPGQSLCERSKPEGVGAELLHPVPTYLMVTRAAQYGTLFLVLAFLTCFLFERVARVSIHVVQYALLGLSVSMFALLLVAVAETLRFTPGYAVATAAVMGQASLYTLAIVGSRRLALTFTTADYDAKAGAFVASAGAGMCI